MQLHLIRTIGLLAFLLTAHGSSAQNSYNWWDARPPAPVVMPPRPTPKPKPVPAAPIDSAALSSGGYLFVEVVPQFLGGQEAYLAYMKKNLERPKGPKLRGKVFVRFIVQPSGAVTDAIVMPGRGLSPAYNAAALDFISRLPKFTPGRRNGATVATALTLPVVFN